MYVCMRTTLVLEDHLFKIAKREAGKEGATLSEIVNRALRRQLLAKPACDSSKAVFSMPVFGEPVTPLHYTPEQLAALRDEGR
jgi:hypothetical protein